MTITACSTSEMPNWSATDYLREILRAPIYDLAIQSPLHSMTRLSARLDNHIQLKREDRQAVHSFKVRGAYNMLAQLPLAQKRTGVITASAGNHAQGVALSGRTLGIPTRIVMPLTTPEIKVQAVRNWGGDVILFGQNFDEAKQHALILSQQEHCPFIPPFDHPHVIAGQGTIGLELLQQNGHLDYIFLPVGGGGLAAGVAVLMKQLMPNIQIIGVEAKDSACLKHALAQGTPSDLDHVGQFADGVAVKRIGNETFRLCQQYLDTVITVTNDEICAAIKDIFEDTRAIAEPSGALALAGLKKYVQQHQIKKKNIATILSGANVNFHRLRYVAEQCDLGEKREALFAVNLPEKKGEFLKFCQQLGNRAVTEFNYRYNDQNQAKIFVGLQLQQGIDDQQAILFDLQKNYSVMDLSEDDIAKVHVRYMIGGRNTQSPTERLYCVEFPESQGALLRFLSVIGKKWNITLFHYRNQGADYGRVLCGIECDSPAQEYLHHQLNQLNYQWQDETDNPAYQFFLK